MTSSATDRELIKRIRAGDEKAWQECIRLYEGRLIAFVDSRLRDRAAAEDVVQETFLGFLTALPNFDETKKIQSFLFAIAAHKLTDLFRKNGRRPTLPLNAGNSSAGDYDPVGKARVASSIARSVERKTGEEEVISQALEELISGWKSSHEFERLKCTELLFVKGYANKEVADLLNISEQAVANHKYFVVSKLKDAAEKYSSDFDLDAFGLSE
ncbi:MAG: sigma-70 family RNA polymerase sigma factor [Planctomicrobium sp.]|jgi:RNA polymerase sigma-70 factor, ECF subfamily|nr:sigma-70 family RNA polymerase sigma factor [Planctomicrobium sp.]